MSVLCRECPGIKQNQQLLALESRGVAQLAERRSPKPKVGGSMPSAPATPMRETQKVNLYV